LGSPAKNHHDEAGWRPGEEFFPTPVLEAAPKPPAD
jgi:hypothetical protein